MRIRELLKSAFATMRMNKRRTVLTMFGIVIGIAAVITILSLGNGFRKQTMDSLAKDEKGRTSQTFWFTPNDYENYQENATPFSEENIEKIEQIEGVDEATTVNQEEQEEAHGMIQTEKPEDSENLGNTSVTIGLVKKFNGEVLAGRAIDELDQETRQRYAMIDADIAHELYESPEKAIHRILTIDNQDYTIIGVYAPEMTAEEENSFFGPSPKKVMIPQKTYEIYNPQESFSYHLRVFYKDGVDMKRLNNEINSYLSQHGAGLSDGKYSFMDESEMMEAVGQQLQMITYFVTSIAGISLFIAGVGVMNMMYISVSERTKEIGIRRSLGATAKSIQWQFLVEGIAITLFGGLIGYGLGVGLSFLIANFLPFPAVIDIPTALLTVAVSIGIGMIFSVFPARSAAQKNVVEILR